MTINCDDCGKEANYIGMPEGAHWLEWIRDKSKGEDAMGVVKCDDGVLAVVCVSCIQKTIDEMTETETP